jgi:hypothetical protein
MIEDERSSGKRNFRNRRRFRSEPRAPIVVRRTNDSLAGRMVCPIRQRSGRARTRMPVFPASNSQGIRGRTRSGTRSTGVLALAALAPLISLTCRPQSLPALTAANPLRTVASLGRGGHLRGPRATATDGLATRDHAGSWRTDRRRAVPPCVSGSGTHKPGAIAAPTVTAGRRGARTVC